MGLFVNEPYDIFAYWHFYIKLNVIASRNIGFVTQLPSCSNPFSLCLMYALWNLKRTLQVHGYDFFGTHIIKGCVFSDMLLDCITWILLADHRCTIVYMAHYTWKLLFFFNLKLSSPKSELLIIEGYMPCVL